MTDLSEAGPGEQDLQDVWRALSDSTRRQLLDLLRERPRNTMELVGAFGGMSRPAVINHVKVLEGVGLVRVESRGRERINHLNATPLQEVYERWLSPFERVWAGRVRALTRTAEEETQTMEHPVRVIEIVQQATSSAPPPSVWEALTARTSAWWAVPYVDHDSVGLELTLSPGGTLWDRRGDDAGYAIGIVRGYKPPAELLIDGEFGIPGALHGRLAVTIRPHRTGSSVTFTHRAIGDIPPDGVAAHEHGWRELVHRLCEFAASQAATNKRS